MSPSGHVMFYLLYKHQWNTEPFHFKFFGVKGVIYHVAIAMVIFSHVKITCYFHMWRYQVFAWKLCWYFIDVYIIKSIIIIIIIIITTMYSGTLPYCHLCNTVTLLLWPLFLGPAKWPYIYFYYINCSVLQGFLPPRNVVSEHT